MACGYWRPRVTLSFPIDRYRVLRIPRKWLHTHSVMEYMLIDVETRLLLPWLVFRLMVVEIIGQISEWSRQAENWIGNELKLDYQPLYKLGSWTWAHWGEYNDWGRGAKPSLPCFPFYQLTGGGVYWDVLGKMEQHLGSGEEDPLGMEKACSSERQPDSISSACRGGRERERMDVCSAVWYYIFTLHTAPHISLLEIKRW